MTVTAGSIENADQHYAPPATGYAPDNSTTIKVNENENAGSQVRIGQSSNVKGSDFKAAG